MKQQRGKGSQEESPGHHGTLLPIEQVPLGIEVFFTLYAKYFPCFHLPSSLKFTQCLSRMRFQLNCRDGAVMSRSKDVRSA